jgi:PAS domain S-box-containing protein
MKLLRQASIQRKQMLIIMLTTTVALLLACAAFVTYEIFTFRAAMVRNLQTMAEIIGDNSAATLDFNDPKAAEETLAALKKEPSMVGACLYLKDGEIFATFDREGDAGVFTPPKLPGQGYSFSGNLLTLFAPIHYKGDNIGMVCLVSDTHALYARLERYAVIVSLVFLVTLSTAFLLSGRLQRLISGPILQLVETASAVARDKNYSLRAVKFSEDELGVLVNAFNGMLEQIEKHDQVLQAAHENLEQRVAERTKELAASVSVLNATLNGTADGIIVTDCQGNVCSYNKKFLEMWRLPHDQIVLGTDTIIPLASNQMKDRSGFLARVHELYGNPDVESHDILEFKDGRTFERDSQPQCLNGESIGRVWCFRDITERRRAEAELVSTHRQLIDTSRQAGMAEVATSVLHNVGNVLNSVNVSNAVVSEKIRNSRVVNLSKIATMVYEHKDDLAGFFTNDSKGKQLPGYLCDLAVHLKDEQQEIIHELGSLSTNIEHIKEIVSMQQGYARVSGTSETLNVMDLVEDAVRMNAGAIERHEVTLVREYGDPVMATVDKHKVLQILVNLIRNAKYALDEGHPDKKLMTLRVKANGDDQIKISVVDNGVGIPARNLTRIFNHGFTTRKEGHGFGLHSGALAARELGGSLTVHSDGPGRGASFTLEFPRQPVREQKL